MGGSLEPKVVATPRAKVRNDSTEHEPQPRCGVVIKGSKSIALARVHRNPPPVRYLHFSLSHCPEAARFGWIKGHECQRAQRIMLRVSHMKSNSHPFRLCKELISAHVRKGNM